MVLFFLPEVISDHENFLRTNRFLEMSDSNFFYFLKIKDYKLKDDNPYLPIEEIPLELIEKESQSE